MSIFPAKNKRGQLTGAFIVEVTRQHKTTRLRTTDGLEARRLERELQAGREPGQSKEREVFTLQMLLEAVRGTYRGTKDERQSIRRLEISLGLLGLDKDVVSIRTPELDKMVVALRERRLGRGKTTDNKTVNRYLATASKALRWALDHDKITGMPKVPRFAESPGRQAYLSEFQEPVFLDWLRDHGRSDVAEVVQYLLLTGFRIQELLDLSVADVSQSGWVHLHAGTTKNDEPRVVYIGETQGASLRALVDRGLPTYRRILDGMSAASSGLKIDPPVTPHVIRHTVATRLNTRGVPTATIMELLGHKNMATTKRYAHVEPEALKKAAEALIAPLGAARRTG